MLVEVVEVDVVDVLVEVVDVEELSVVVLLSFTVKFVVLVRLAMSSSSMRRSCSSIVPLEMLLIFSLERVMVVVDIAVFVVIVVVDVVVVVVVDEVDVAVSGQIGGRQEPSPLKRVWYAGHEQTPAEARRGEVPVSHGVPCSAVSVAATPGSSAAKAAAAAASTATTWRRA